MTLFFVYTKLTQYIKFVIYKIYYKLYTVDCLIGTFLPLSLQFLMMMGVFVCIT